ncbi:MAG: peroxidase family protein, partial [Planctomycetaceae bacterium]
MLSAAPIDGSGNNLDHPDWGSVGAELLRPMSAHYGDGLTTPSGEDRPNPRDISNAVVAQDGLSITNDRLMTDFIWVWGQFVDHDLDLTEPGEPLEPMNVPVPSGDQWFDPFGTSTAEIGLNRSRYVVDANGMRQQFNQITAFLDGSMVYGSDAVRAASLRSFEGGRLKTSAGGLLPFNVDGLPNGGGPSASLFLAGDVRVNENVALTSMHTLWVREHNRIADEIADGNPTLSDEEIYQQARSIVAGEIEAITFNEFLPALLGPAAIGAYGGYDATVNPGIANVFSTAAYRLGHSLLSPQLRLDYGNVVEFLGLRDAFFRPDRVNADSVEALLRGAAGQRAQELDAMIVDDVRNFLFGPPGAGGFDLATLNIQRGRDHGLPDYNTARSDMGLQAVDGFDDITSDPVVQARLASIYESVDQIDIWIGGLAEDHLPGSSLGELFTTIVVDQFERVRAGDRFWHQSLFSGELLAEIEGTTLADVIQRNTGITGLQENVFFDEAVLYYEIDGPGAHAVTLQTRGNRIEIVDHTAGTVTRRRIRDVEQVL